MNQNELAHQWAHQVKPRGKASAFSYEGPVIRSYSTAIGRILAPGIYLVNMATFSVTTSGKHQAPMRMAIPHNTTTLYFEDGRKGTDLNPSGADVVAWNIQQIADCLAKAGRARARARAPMWHAEAEQWVERTRQAAAFYNVALPADLEATAQSIARTMETVRAEAEKQAREAAARREADAQEKLAQWLAGESVTVPSLPHARFRVKGDTVESTLGITLPLEDFTRAVRFAVSRRGKPWRAESAMNEGDGPAFAVGSYSIQAIGPDGVVAGCHRVTWSEVDRLAVLLS